MRAQAKVKGNTTKVVMLTIIALCLLLVDLPVLSEEDEAFRADINGQKTWSLRYGLGDPQGLAQAGVAAYQLILDQSLAVDITGEALSILTINAHFNDQEPMSMQSLKVNLDAGDLKGVFGDFSISGKEVFAVYNKKLKGARLDYQMGEARLTGILSQIEGISESRTFVGRTAHEEVLFSASPPGQPWLHQPYLRNIDGLYHYELEEPFVEDFSLVSLAFDPSEPLRGLLTTYNLAYLFDLVAASPSEELSVGSFIVVSDTKDVLLLRSEPATFLRERLKDYIKAYNNEDELTEEQKKRYPFNIGTDYELAFLEQLAVFVSLVVDGQDYPLTEGGRRRYYDLRRTNLKEDSLVVEVSVAGGTFRPITDPDFADYRTVLYPNEGIIELDFPASFFVGSDSAVRVSFDYAISGDMFMLGLSLVPGSEKVYLNGTLLERDVDYSIDYEIGALTLFVEVGDEDTIRIDYERFRGGLGGFAEYPRDFYGVSFGLPLFDVLTLEFSLLQAADSPTPLVDPDKARTMPNTHTVSGVVGSVQLEDFTAEFTLGYNYDRFPFDDNLRIELPNEVTAILTLPDYTFVGHLGGISVYHGGKWSGYNTADGLAGNRIYDIVSDEERIFIATSSGLTVLTLEGEAPLAHVGNWRRYYVEDGLPHASIHALALIDGTLWVGTEEGLASVKVAEIDTPASWRAYTDELFIEMGSILALTVDEETLYIGSERGLFALDDLNKTLIELPGTEGIRVWDLLFVDRTLYMASELGLRAFHDGTGTGWLVFGKAVHSLASIDGELLYGCESGLFRISSDEPILADWEVTGLASTPEGTLWAGSRADLDYRLMVWEIDEVITPFANALTEIDGRDRFRFTDISAEDHTDRGLLGRVSFQRDMGRFTLSGSFESISPAFTSIGRLGRSDSTGWNLSGTAHPTDDIKLTASHSYHLIDQGSDRGRSTMENNVSFAWDFGPHLGFSLKHGVVNDDRIHKGFDEGKISYEVNLQDKLFDERLDLSLRWNEALSGDFLLGTLRRDNRLGVKGACQLLPDLSISADWGRPMAFATGEPTGSEKWGLSADWSHRFDVVNASAAYTLSAGRSLPLGTFRTTQTVKLDLRIERFNISEFQLTPGLDLSLEDKEGIISLSGRGTLYGTFDMFSTRVTFSEEVSGLGEPRQQRRDRFSLNFGYNGFPDLKPTLIYTQNSSAVIYLGEARPTLNRTLTGRLSWIPQDGPRNTLSISLRSVTRDGENTITAIFRNSFSYAITDAISSQVDLDGHYAASEEGLDDLDLSLRGDVNLTLSETWRASLGASYFTGTKSSGGLYHSLLLELFIAVMF